MKPTLKLAIVAVFVAAALAIVFLAKGGSKDKDQGTPTAQTKPVDQVTAITVVYSTEKKEWIEATTAEFAKAHPEI